MVYLVASILVCVVVVVALGIRSSTFPECTSIRAAADFESTFNGSQYAQTLNLSVIDVLDQRAISDDTIRMRRVCQATLMLNNAQNLTYRFTFTERPNVGYYIEGRPARQPRSRR